MCSGGRGRGVGWQLVGRGQKAATCGCMGDAHTRRVEGPPFCLGQRPARDMCGRDHCTARGRLLLLFSPPGRTPDENLGSSGGYH